MIKSGAFANVDILLKTLLKDCFQGFAFAIKFAAELIDIANRQITATFLRLIL
jgi:hypothetical protein